MSKFRKKPVVVEAFKWTGRVDLLTAWGRDVGFVPRFDLGAVVTIPTLEGIMTAQKGDWIIKGVKGEFYPCKPHIFEELYEAVDAGGTP
jgi:hypothetical protein